MLGFVSLALIRPSGIPAYLDMLASFSHAKTTGQHLLFFDVDAFAFFLPFLGKYTWFAVLALAVAVMPFLIQAWRRDPAGSFALAITWTLVLNFYVVIYDSTLIILAVVLTAGALARPHLPRSFRWLLLLLFLVPWVARQSAQNYGFQPMTIALIAFGCYQLWATLSSHRGISIVAEVPVPEVSSPSSNLTFAATGLTA